MTADLLLAKPLRTATLPVQTEGGSVELALQALPRRRYRKLLEDHPGSDDSDWNADTFPPALIAASVTDPKLTVEQATEIWEGWEDEEASRLFLACFYLNENQSRLGFMLPGSAKISGSGRNSTTAPPEESPTPSS